ncbi:unnamed protein product [Rhizoctonia solani]|uniref:RING-type domain-containing protein n=1 Tax=Rhizoctonia solani TaxID=456999 RepID=A0A8H3DCU2_9AGAM|nr:unnamed protein product [Rhizoctonia solani]
MGNTGSSSGKHSHSHNIRDETVDFGHLSPQGIYTGPQDWNQELVGKLIVDRKLAPFYRPLEDYEPNWDDETILRNRKLKPGEESLPPSMTLSVSGPAAFSGKGSTKGKGVADRREQQRMSEAEVYHGAIECPICFMYYPPNINRSRCCDQAICTECFVQIKRSEPTTTHIVSEPAACPYCVQENFGVIYEPPSWRAGLVLSSSGSPSRPELPRLAGSAISSTSGDSQGHPSAERSRRKSASQGVEVVTIDYIRPDWEAKLEAVRATVARRANRRIVMRQVGDRLIPVGITSGRVVPVNIGEGDASGSGRRSRRQRGPGGSGELPVGITGHDLEELMMMEAMRLSLIEHEAQQRRERETAARAPDPSSSAPPREIANISPDPASELQQPGHEHRPSHTDSSLSVTSAGLPPSTGPGTPLRPSSSGALEPVSDQSSVVSPRESFDASQAVPPSHRRIGSGPIQVASSPLNGAAALAMAVGFPSAPDASAAGDVHTGQSGFPPRTLNALSAAVSASGIPVAILGSTPNDLPENEPGIFASDADRNTNQDDQTQAGQSAAGHSSLGEPLGQSAPEGLVTDDTSPPAQGGHTTAVVFPSSTSISRPTSPSVDNSAIKDTSSAPIAERDSQNGDVSSATFLSADARTTTETSLQTVDTQQSKGDSYSILPSSPEMETTQPLMSGPPNLARLDTEDSYHAPGGSSAV